MTKANTTGGERLELTTVACSVAVIAVVLVSRKTSIDTSAATVATTTKQSSRAQLPKTDS